MTPLRLIAAVAVVCAAAYLLAWPVAIDPVAWMPAPTPGPTGPFAHSVGFTDLRPVAPDVGDGPEAVTQGPDGFVYTGLQDGWIVRFRPDGPGPAERVVQTGGRPLGLQFDATGHLIVADAFRGLLSVAPDRTIAVLVEAVDGQRVRFPNALNIAADGAVWFSDASQRFDQHHWRLDYWEGRATGRLLRYDPQTRQTTVRLEELRFANGVALGPDDAFVLVNETVAARIHRLWLTGPRAGTREIFLDGLPGYPDNLSYNGRDLFWVALAAPRVAALDRLARSPWLRQVLFRLPAALTDVRPQAVAWVLGVDVRGTGRHHLRETAGRYATITSVQEVDGVLWLGSLFGRAVDSATYTLTEPDAGIVFREAGWAYTGHQYSYTATHTHGYNLPDMAGTDTLPHDIQQAALELCKGMWLARQRDPAVSMESVPDVYTVQYGGQSRNGTPIGAIPPNVQELLLPYMEYKL